MSGNFISLFIEVGGAAGCLATSGALLLSTDSPLTAIPGTPHGGERERE